MSFEPSSIKKLVEPIERLFDRVNVDPQAKNILFKFLVGVGIGVTAGLFERKHHRGLGAAEILVGNKLAECALNSAADPIIRKQGSRAIRAGILLGLGTTELTDPNATRSQKILGFASELTGGFEALQAILDYRSARAGNPEAYAPL